MPDHDKLTELDALVRQHLRNCTEAYRENAKAHRWMIGLLISMIFGVISLLVKGHG